VYKFTIDSESMELINNAKQVYEQMNGNSDADVFVLWWNDNDDGSFQGYRLYYNPEQTIVVGLACDHCYTVGFVGTDDKQHRTTYTLEWSTPDDDSDSISGRIITTYAPIKVKSVSNGSKQSTVVINTDNLDKLMEQMQIEGMEKYQKELEMVQKKLEKTQARLEKELSKYQDKSNSFSSSSSSSNSGQLVKGRVIDVDGEPLIGAMVQPIGPLGPGNGTATDFNGEFSLSSLSDQVRTLKVSYVGYKTQELPVQPNMVITMEVELPKDNLSDLFLRRTVPKENSLTEKSPTPSNSNSKDWMKKLLFYVEKVQQPGDRYLYLSKLYELCKDTEGLDQMDLKIAAKQLESVYKQLKDKKKLKENELIFLESMVYLLHSKIKN
jgi:hypothetical protein